jgi:uncharacterized protein
MDNPWVLITSASTSFGEQLARRYAGEGYSLILVARRQDELRRLGDELAQKYPIEVVVEQVDLSDIAAAMYLHERLRERGISIDLMINSAGQKLRGPFLDGPLDAALAMVQLDIAGLAALTRFLRDT